MNTRSRAVPTTVAAWVIASGLTLLAAGGQFQPPRPLGGLQRPTTRPPMGTAPPEIEQPQQPKQPTFRTAVELVELTVVAPDKDGQFVGDLTADDFQVFDEGTPQTLSAFTKVDIPLPHTLPNAAAVPAPALPPADTASSDLHPDARLFVLVLDDLHVSPERTRRVRLGARQFVERHTSPEDLVAVVTPSGRKDMLLGFTRDRARLLSVIDQFQGQKLRSASLERDRDKYFGGGSALRDGRDPSDGERMYRARVSMTTLADVSTMLASTQGRRKSLLYFSEGVDYNVADVMGTVQRYASEVTHTIEHALSTALRTNVAVYAIDPRGLMTGDSDAIELPIYSEQPAVDLRGFSEPGRTGELSQSIRSLRDLAEPTGGFAAADTNDLDAAFARIVRENSTYYVLGFQPSQGSQKSKASKRDAAGAFRKLDVRVKRTGVTLTTRAGYLVPRRDAPAPPPPPASAPGSATAAATAAAISGLSPELAPLLASALPASGLAVRVQAIPFKGTAAPSKTSLHLVVEIDGRNLTFESKDSRHTERLDLAMLTVDQNGKASNGTQTTLALKLTPEELARVQTTGVRWQSMLDLSPGHYQLRVAARAAATSRRGLVIAEIDVPDFSSTFTPSGSSGSSDAVALSGIALTSLPSVLALNSGQKPPFVSLTSPPTAVREFVVGDRITAVVQVYSAAAHADGLRVTARVESAATSGSDAATMKPLEAAQRIKTGSGARDEVAFAFGTDSMPPGPYILTLRVNRPDGGPALAERRIAYSVVKKP